MRFVHTVILLFIAAEGLAQTFVDSTYRVELTLTASPAVSVFRNASIPGAAHETAIGGGGFVRALWHPGRLLSIGLMSGYMLINEDEIPAVGPGAGILQNNYHARLTAIPLQVAISMQKHNLDIGIGMGPYLMLTNIEGGNSAPASGQRLELGLTFFGSYFFSAGSNVRIGPELRVLYLRYRGILSWMPSCSVRIDALRY
jgi:hypothetical protein